jgi:hypothetical protein
MYYKINVGDFPLVNDEKHILDTVIAIVRSHNQKIIMDKDYNAYITAPDNAGDAREAILTALRSNKICCEAVDDLPGNMLLFIEKAYRF